MRHLILSTLLVTGCTGVAELSTPPVGPGDEVEVLDPTACAPPPARLRRLTPLQLEATLEAGLRVDDGQARPATWQPLRNRFNTTLGIIGALQPTAPETDVFSHEANVEAATPLFFAAMVSQSATLSTQALGRLDACIAAGPDEACVARVVREVGARLFRRPLSDEAASRYLEGLATWAATMPRRDALALTLRRLVLAPETVFRFEVPGADGRLDDYALAEWLAYTLTDAPPSPALTAAAAGGRLRTADDLAREAGALLSSLRTAPALERFASEWVPYESAWDRRGNERATSKPQVRARSEAAFRDLTSSFFAAEPEARTVEAWLGGTAGWVNADLAAWYGVADAGVTSTSTWARVELPAERRGALLRPGFLVSRTGVTSRALFIRDRLLCAPLPEPPVGVNTDLDEVTESLERMERRQLSPREVRELHMRAPSCAGCHSMMDPLGFPLDSFDGEGLPRTMLDGFPIEPSGAIAGTASSDGPVANAGELVDRLSRSVDVQRCVATWAFDFVNAEHAAAADACALSDARRAFVASGGDFKALWQAVVSQPRWLERRPEAP